MADKINENSAIWILSSLLSLFYKLLIKEQVLIGAEQTNAFIYFFI
jgi:hypothetical protein